MSCSTRISTPSGRPAERRDFAILQLPPRTDFQRADLNRTYPGTHKFQNLAADRFHHPSHLAVASFADLDFDVRVLAGIAHAFHFGRARRAVAEVDPFSQLF